jgi:sugar lactone lactonase YvrE
MKRALIATATVAATISIAACSTSTPNAGPTTTAVSKPAATSSSTPAAGQATSCAVNPSSAPVPTAEKYDAVSPDARISASLSGIPSGTIKPGDQPTDVEVTLCNNSPVDYPKVGVVFVLTQCSCAIYPSGLPQGTADRFDPATGRWIPLGHPVITTGADYLGGFSDVQELPKGKQVTLKYRVALDASMTDGKGAVQATVVVPDDLVQIGKADLPFTVSKQSTTPSNAPATRQTVLPFTGLTYPISVAVDAADNVYLTDTGNDRVLKLAAGSNEQTVLPFTGLHSPGAVAVDSDGNVYITDYVTATTDFNVPNSRVVKLAVGSNDQSVLPFTGLSHVHDVAVDTAGNVYVADNTRGADTKVVKLAAGSNDQTVLPFTGITSANAVVVDGAGSVYVNDGPNNRVVKLAAGSTDQTVLPLTGLEYPDGMAVGTAGDVYVIDGKNSQVVKFAAGSNDQTAVPSTVLYGPEDVAVDGAGNVYVVDNSGFGQVVKLEAG